MLYFYPVNSEVPRVLNSQKRDKEVIVSIITVSTIISAVTAAIIPESLGTENPSALYNAVNAFWFFSLAFSVASVVQSLLDLFRRSYMQYVTPYLLSGLEFHTIPFCNTSDKRSEYLRIPVPIAYWIRIGPRVFLGASIMTFQAGLCVLAYASNQVRLLFFLYLHS